MEFCDCFCGDLIIDKLFVVVFKTFIFTVKNCQKLNVFFFLHLDVL